VLAQLPWTVEVFEISDMDRPHLVPADPLDDPAVREVPVHRAVERAHAERYGQTRK